MNRLKTQVFKAGLRAMHASGAHKVLSPIVAGRGIIFTMHHVKSGRPAGFAPNHILEITPEFLESTITMIRWAGLDIVSLDEAHERIKAPDAGNRFAVLTFDDGYLDNFETAYPILKRMDAPFCVYVSPGLPDGTADLWWLALEEVIRRNDRIVCSLDDRTVNASSRTNEEKNALYETIYWWMRSCGEDRQRSFIRHLCEAYGVDMAALCADLAMSWDDIRGLSIDPLATIGAHTMCHYALARLDAERARQEMNESARVIADKIGFWPQHFSFPYGDPGSAGARDFEIARRLGFKTAVTTRPGVVFEDHSAHMHCLPRVSLNGAYQSEAYLELFLSGAPFAVFNRFRRVNAA